jgi:hypothetical protein
MNISPHFSTFFKVLVNVFQTGLIGLSPASESKAMPGTISKQLSNQFDIVYSGMQDTSMNIFRETWFPGDIK